MVQSPEPLRVKIGVIAFLVSNVFQFAHMFTYFPLFSIVFHCFPLFSQNETHANIIKLQESPRSLSSWDPDPLSIVSRKLRLFTADLTVNDMFIGISMPATTRKMKSFSHEFVNVD